MADQRSAEFLVSLMRTEHQHINAYDKLQALRILSGKEPNLEDEPVVKNLLSALTQALQSKDENLSPKNSGEYAKILLNARAAIVRKRYPSV